MAMPDAMFDLGTLSASGSTTGITIPHSGTFGFFITAAITVGSAKVEVSPSDSGTTDYMEVPDGTWTATGYKKLEISGRRVRVTATGVTVSVAAKMAVPPELA